MGKTCELCHMEIVNETYVVHPIPESYEEKLYHYVCFLIIGDGESDYSDEEMQVEPLNDILNTGSYSEIEFNVTEYNPNKKFPSAA